MQHVLDMTTGVRFSEEYTDPLFRHRPGRCRLRLEAGAAGQRSGLPLAGAYVGADPRAEGHRRARMARHFEYRSIETDVLAFLMERVTGKRLRATGFARSSGRRSAPTRAPASPSTAPAMRWPMAASTRRCATMRRFGQLILDGGRGIVPADWIEATRNGMHGPDFNDSLPGRLLQEPVLDRGSAQSRTLMCRGVFGQLIHIDFDTRMVVVKLSTYPDFTNIAYSMATLAAIARHRRRPRPRSDAQHQDRPS